MRNKGNLIYSLGNMPENLSIEWNIFPIRII